MLANPEMVAGRHDRLDTSLMKAAPGRLVSKAGMEALRGVAILPGPRSGTSEAGRDRDGDQDRGRRRLRPRDVGGDRSRRSARPACSTAAPCATSPATTGRRSSTRTDASAPRRSPSSSSRRWASSSADGRPAGRPNARSDRHSTMALDPDPYRTLGLTRGATLDEVKRAYRRLAKINHPDAAGEAALPRFLAIQAAYEQLVGPAPGTGRRPTAGPATAVGRRPAGRRTRRAYGGRARNAPPRRPRAREAPARPGRAGAAGAGGAAGGSAAAGRAGAAAGPVARDRPGAPAAASATARSAANLRAAPRLGHARRRRRPAAKPRAPQQGDARVDVVRRGGRRPVRARLGRRQLVRHHERHVLDAQPEGIRRSPQARAGVPGTRPASGPSARRGSVRAPAPTPRRAPDATRPATRRARRPGDGRPPGRPDPHDSSWWDSTAGPAGAATIRTAAPARRRRSPPRDRRAPRRPAQAGRAARHGPTTAAARPRARRGRHHPRPDRRPLRWRRAAGSARALIGWLPIALGLGWLVGEMTGCGRFAATCDDGVAGPMLFVLQVVVLGGPARRSRPPPRSRRWPP